jgi:hypothetical protein
MGIVGHWCQAGPDSDSALGREQDEGDHQPGGEDHPSGGEADRVPVHSRVPEQAGGARVAGQVTGHGAGEDRAEQGGADRSADLLGGVDCCRGDAGVVAVDAEGRGGE